MAPRPTPIDDAAEFANPNVVKVVLDAAGRALYFSRAPIPSGAIGSGAADLPHAAAAAPRRPLRLPRRLPAPLSHAAAAPLEPRRRSSSCACCGTATASRCT